MVRKKRGTVSTTSVLIIAVVIIVAGAVGGYFVGNITGYQKGYRSGYETGYETGYKEAKEEYEPVYSTPEEIRDAVMSYIRDHHPDTARLIEEIEWSGGDITPTGLVGARKYQYLGGGWNVTISWPVIPKPTYEVRAEYRSPIGDLRIYWEGAVDQTGAVAEKIKGSYQSVESVRDVVMDYIRKNHPDAAYFIKDLAWSVTPPEPIPGWTMYQYIGDGWNITIGYVVYYDITYEVAAENQQEGISWTGTVHDGAVSETSYEKV